MLDKDVGGHDEKGWLGWQLHDNKIVLEIFVPSDLRYRSRRREILIAILDIFLFAFCIHHSRCWC